MKFWEVCWARVAENPAVLQEVVVVPLFKGEVKVLNVSFRPSRIPPQDLDLWISRHCELLLGSQRKMDTTGAT